MSSKSHSTRISVGKQPQSPTSNPHEKLIGSIPGVCVQNEEHVMIEGSMKMTLINNLLTFQFRANRTLDGKRQIKNAFTITFTVDDISAIGISSQLQHYENVNFTTLDKHLPTFFFSKDNDVNVFTFMNVIIENGFTIIPKDGQPNVFIIHRRLEKISETLSSVPIDFSEIQPIGLQTIMNFANEDGSFSESAEEDVRKSMYFSGLQSDARVFVWKLVLGYYSFRMTTNEREELDKRRRKEYFNVKSQWELFIPEQLKNWPQVTQTFEQIDKDVRRTDNKHEKFLVEKNVTMLRDILRTYAMFNWKIGYGQGMNDICSMIMEITLDEPEIFWIFKSVMDIMEPFYRPRKSNEAQTFEEVGYIIKFVSPSLYDYFVRNNVNYLFCYRWIVLLFKREFNPQDCLSVWDRIFAYPDRKLYYFISSSIILKEGDQIVEQQKGFDGMVEFLQTMHKKIQLQVVFDSDIIYRQFMVLADRKYLDLLYQDQK